MYLAGGATQIYQRMKEIRRSVLDELYVLSSTLLRLQTISKNA